MIKEYCLIPKHIVEKYIPNNKNDDFHIIERKVTETPNIHSSDYQPNIEELIKKNVPKNRIEKSLQFYDFLKNITILEYLPNGQILAPIKNVNLINFIKDVNSNPVRKKISIDKLKDYKLLTNFINIPSFFF